MFFGTKWHFKFSFFWTSMIPAYIIFLTRIFSGLQCINKQLAYGVLIGYLLVTSTSLLVLKQSIKNKRDKRRATKEIIINFNPNKNNEQSIGINNVPIVETGGFYKVNSGLISYLLGTVFSSGTLSFVSSDSILIKIIIFLIVQTLIWLYVMNSSDSVPNIALVLLKKDLVSINDKYWILTDRHLLKEQLVGAKKIVPFASTDSRNRLFVFQNKES